MNYKKRLPIFFLASLLIFATVSCSDTISEKPNPGFVLNSEVHITYTNKAGDNLLNPSTPGSYDHKDIRVYYLKNGHKKLLVVDSSSHHLPKKLWGVDTVSTIQRGHSFLSILLPGTKFLGLPKNAKTTTLIKLQKGIVDTLTAQFRSGPDFLVVDKVWYNGQLKWSQSKDTTGNIHFTIRK